jgi:hypothetical protein
LLVVLVFGLIAGTTYFGFGHDAGQLLDFAESLAVILTFFLVTLFLVYFVLIPFHRAFERAAANVIESIESAPPRAK